VFGFEEAVVVTDGGGEVFVVVDGGGENGEGRREEGGLVWWGPCEVPWFGPHIDAGD